jgi:hypothetical protein
MHTLPEEPEIEHFIPSFKEEVSLKQKGFENKDDKTGPTPWIQIADNVFKPINTPDSVTAK